MNFRIYEPQNLKETINFTRSLPRTLAIGINRGMRITGKSMVLDTRKRMRSGTFSGRTYRIRGRNHRASATGEYPHRITGRLSRSINSKTFGARRMEFGATAEYAKYLEEGTSKMGARKYLVQTAKRFDKQFEVDIITQVNIEIRKKNVAVK